MNSEHIQITQLGIIPTSQLNTIHNNAQYQDYFHPSNLSKITSKLFKLLENQQLQSKIQQIIQLNNLHYKKICLIYYKNCKIDIISYPPSSQLFLSPQDLIIIDGDRGKDMGCVVLPTISLELAVLVNYLKKREYLQTVNLNNEDNEMIINLPTKQVLRFASFEEVLKLQEKKEKEDSCLAKCKEISSNMNLKLNIIDCEYQFDFKKLIFYYFVDHDRCDFRNLVKQLFKFYKTRIWMCAVPVINTKNKTRYYHDEILNQLINDLLIDLQRGNISNLNNNSNLNKFRKLSLDSNIHSVYPITDFHLSPFTNSPNNFTSNLSNYTANTNSNFNYNMTPAGGNLNGNSNNNNNNNNGRSSSFSSNFNSNNYTGLNNDFISNTYSPLQYPNTDTQYMNNDIYNNTIGGGQFFQQKNMPLKSNFFP